MRLTLVLVIGMFMAFVSLPGWSVAIYEFTSIAREGSSNVSRFWSTVGLANDGTVVFGGVSSDGAATVYTGTGGSLRTVASEGDTFTDLSTQASISENTGLVAVEGKIDAGAFAVYSVDGNGTITEIARIGESVTGSSVGEATFDLIAFSYGRQNDIADDGTVAMVGAAHAQDTDQFTRGIYESSGGAITPFIESNDLISVKRFASTNNVGDTAVVVELKASGEQLLIYGNQVISTQVTGFKSFGDVSLNDSNAVAFTAILDSGEQGVFLAGNTGVVILIADSTGPYQSFSRVAMNDFASIAFEATLDVGGKGVFSGPDAVVDRIIGEGDQLFNRTVADVSLGVDARNDAGSVAFSAEFVNADERVVRADLDADFVSLPDSRDLLDLYAQMSTMSGAGVSMSQWIDFPTALFDFSFDLEFLTEFGELSVMLGDLLFGIFGPDDSGHLLFSDIKPGSLFQTGVPPETVLLQFLFNGPPGAAIRIDAVTLPGLLNGDFELGFFEDWSIDTSHGGLAFVSAFDTPAVPEPGTLGILVLGLACLGFARRRRPLPVAE